MPGVASLPPTPTGLTWQSSEKPLFTHMSTFFMTFMNYYIYIYISMYNIYGYIYISISKHCDKGF